jgi:hypothetical protein
MRKTGFWPNQGDFDAEQIAVRTTSRQDGNG